MNEIDSITARIEAPTVADEVQKRELQCDVLRDWFKAHPLVEASPDMLESLVGPNYRSRIADLRKQLPRGYRIELVKHWIDTDAKTKRGAPRKQRLLGGYRYLPYQKLGPSAEIERPRESTNPQERMF